MRDFFKLKTWLITVIIIILAISISIVLVYFEFRKDIREVRAGSGDNVSGFAWSENIGWISFNSTDCDIDDDGVFEGNNEGDPPGSTPAPAGCPTSGTANGYGVNIDRADGWFSGHAWSQHVGWIDFAPTDSYPNDPQDPEPHNFAARLIIDAGEDANKKIAGWAKILSLGDDGWIKMTGTSTAEDPYGVTLNVLNSKVNGWAWNANADNSGIGWISFNNTDYQVLGFFNTRPIASPTPMTFPGHCNYNCACGFQGVLKPQLLWFFDDPDPNSEQTAYEVVFNTSDIDPETISDGSGASLPLKTSKLAGAANSLFPHNNIYRDVTINYNQPYYWWIRVWDNYGASSTWAQFDDDPDNRDGDGNTKTFTTYEHEFPEVDFTWFPEEPSEGEEIQLTDASQVYLSGAPNTPVACDSSRCDWLWIFPPSATIVEGTTASSTLIITFDSTGPQSVTLRVTNKDGTGYNCSRDKSVGTNIELPTWKEVKPE